MYIENIDKNGFVNYFETDFQSKKARIGSHDGRTGHSDNCITLDFNELNDYVAKNKTQLINDFGKEKYKALTDFLENL